MGGGSTSSPGGRKNQEKFYVVYVGRRCGIFQSWKECESQVKGYPRNVYESFTSREEAERSFNNFVLGGSHSSTPGSGKGKYYAVFEGKCRGVYDSWAKCSEQVLGALEARYLSYDSQEEAMTALEGYLINKINGDKNPGASASEEPSSSSVPHSFERDANQRIQALELEVQKTREERDQARKKCEYYEEILSRVTSLRYEEGDKGGKMK